MSKRVYYPGDADKHPGTLAQRVRQCELMIDVLLARLSPGAQPVVGDQPAGPSATVPPAVREDGDPNL